VFKLQPNPTFWWTVQIPVAGEDPQPLEVEFRRMKASALRTFGSTIEGREPIDAVSDLVVGWRNVDADFSRERMAELLEEYPKASDAILLAYAAAYQDAKRGN
jgi:predicted nucleic acid-binding protein